MLKYGVPVAALLMAAFAVVHVVHTYPAQPLAEPPHAPAQPPFGRALAASGVLEARPGNIAVAAPVAGVVAEVSVQAGQAVSAGAPLFRLDDRTLRAELRVREAKLATARALVARLEQPARADELAASAARIGEARAHLEAEKARLERGQQRLASKLVNQQDIEQLRQAVTAARQQLARAEAEDRLLRAGSAEAERAVARATAAEAEALVAQGNVELNRLTVCAPVEGTVLQVHVHAGEAVGGPGPPPVVLGAVRPLTLRVSIDAPLIGRFRSSAPARAMPRGRPQTIFPLRFVRVEPLIVPRRVLSGDSGERTDTRVLQVLYELDPGQETLYVGQQMDVFIETEPAR